MTCLSPWYFVREIVKKKNLKDNFTSKTRKTPEISPKKKKREENNLFQVANQQRD